MPKRPTRLDTRNIYIGVDPGMKGGLCWLDDNEEGECVPMPKTPDGMFDEKAVWDWFTYLPQENLTAAIEKVWSVQGQGISSAFKFGQAYGFLRACLVGHNIPFYDVTAMTWQKNFGLQRPKRFSSGEWKKSLHQTAREWFPDKDIKLEAADSLLIAYYCKRVGEGHFPKPKPSKPKKSKRRSRK